MKIAICDDEPLFRSELKEKLVAYKQTNRMWMDIYEFEDGTSLLESELVFDIIYLDYQMPHLDGMKTARSLRERNNICNICQTVITGMRSRLRYPCITGKVFL